MSNHFAPNSVVCVLEEVSLQRKTIRVPRKSETEKYKEIGDAEVTFTYKMNSDFLFWGGYWYT